MKENGENRFFSLSTYYEKYEQACAFMLGYLLECQKEENITVLKIEYIK